MSIKKILTDISAMLFGAVLAIGFILGAAYTFSQCVNHNPAPVTSEAKKEVIKQDTVQWSCIRPPKIENLERSVIVNGKPWPVGKILKVKLSSGSAQQNNYFHAATDTVSKWANLTFDYSPQPSGIYDLRIELNNYGASWSYIGQDALLVSQSSPTLVVGWTGFDVSAHELLHACGFAHEQSNPNTTICWNKPVVYAELGGPPNNWSKAMVDYNVFYTYPISGVIASVFDPISIMQYTIKGSWTCNGVGISGGKNLSPLDRAALVKTYPGRTTPPIVSGITLTPTQVAQLKAAINDLQTSANATKTKADGLKTLSNSLLGL